MRLGGAAVSSSMTSKKNEIYYSRNISPEKTDVFNQAKRNKNQAAYPGEKKLIEAVEKENPDIMGISTNLEFSVHKKTKQIMVKIVDSNTKEVLKELPSEKILDMAAHMMEKAGIFIDKKA
ncbi:flagellar protein FlaG [Peptoclostridium litorale DSM 5388]|uniref:Flagellar protein FlaG n=1 Tax=Peptoclostridium litorale DSM 5388 TaxID=1121324 RepID=A0A069RFL9_PEPLI|nr:flagellar protein FlaG [Peptoclostridium litorale]KDR95811.1 hypothetical protein CLIT_10c05390 [Peptoclostridium litorale DSM 5388]SIO20846.1 flagellar protein FlaG [Peptoclostridium litorale DSM 5388]